MTAGSKVIADRVNFSPCLLQPDESFADMFLPNTGNQVCLVSCRETRDRFIRYLRSHQPPDQELSVESDVGKTRRQGSCRDRRRN